jgi:hypothetical protein
VGWVGKGLEWGCGEAGEWGRRHVSVLIMINEERRSLNENGPVSGSDGGKHLSEAHEMEA